MFQAVFKLFRYAFYAALLILGVSFALSNRQPVALSLYPFPYALSVPLFLFTIVILALGVFLGWVTGAMVRIRHAHAHRRETRKLHALEDEVTALRTEQAMKSSYPPSLPAA